MKSDVLLVFRNESVDLPAGMEALDPQTLALAVEIADDNAAVTVRSYGFAMCRNGQAISAAGRQVYHAPQRGADALRDFLRCADYLVRRGLALRVSAKRVAL